MILKLLLVIGVIAAVYILFFKKAAPVTGKKSESASKPTDDDTMVPCETCGVFVSIKEAFMKDGKYYCSKTCMERK